MQMKFDWSLDPGSTPDATPSLPVDHLLSAGSDVEAEFFVNLGCSPPTLPSDDIWKKFDDFDEFEDIDELLKDASFSSMGWMSSFCDSHVPGKDAREIRNHDCMWAGHCVSEKHDKGYSRTRHIMPVIRKEPRDSTEPKVVAVTTPNGTVTTDGSVCVKKKHVVAPTHARSLLIPSKVARCNKALDSGGESPRPETPLSLSEDEDLDCDELNLIGIGDDELDLYLKCPDEEAVPPSKVTGQTNVKPEPVAIERHYQHYTNHSDHSYHLSKSNKMDHLGVQTPSDSEEEIDVETVCGDSKKPHSRSSSSGSPGVGLPTNPSPLDRHQLQLTVASAIKKESKRYSVRAGTGSTRYSLDERTLERKRKSEVRRTVGKKRGAQSEDREYGKKRKRQRHHLKSKRSKSRKSSHARHAGTGSSDSELDSTEKRSLHNNMERQRRVDLRNAFEELRRLIPDTADNQRAPKVLILSQGAEYCYNLSMEEQELTHKRAELRRQQEMLRAKLSQLRRSLAARR